MFTYGIPSFHRPECKAIDTLCSLGIEKDRIIVSLQDEQEVHSYEKFHSDVRYIVRKADCAAGNRNTLLKNLETPLVIIDDDITSFAFKGNKMSSFKKIEDAKSLESIILQTVDIAKDNDIPIIGCAATSNDLVARNRTRYSYDVLLQGSFLVFLAPLFFDERWKMVEDYELSLRAIRMSHTMRDNYLCARKPKNGTNKGGLHERYASNELPYWVASLGKQYREFKPNKEMTGGSVRYE